MTDIKTVLLGLSGVVYLVVSEVLPFIDSIESNGILHFLCLINKKYKPRDEEREPIALGIPERESGLLDGYPESNPFYISSNTNTKKIDDIYAHITRINKYLDYNKTVLKEYSHNLVNFINQIDQHLDNIEKNENRLAEKLGDFESRLSRLES